MMERRFAVSGRRRSHKRRGVALVCQCDKQADAEEPDGFRGSIFKCRKCHSRFRMGDGFSVAEFDSWSVSHVRNRPYGTALVPREYCDGDQGFDTLSDHARRRYGITCRKCQASLLYGSIASQTELPAAAAAWKKCHEVKEEVYDSWVKVTP